MILMDPSRGIQTSHSSLYSSWPLFAEPLLIKHSRFSVLSSSYRTVCAAEGSGHSSGEELACDLGQRGDHDRGLLFESFPGFGQEEGGPDYHRL